MRYQESLTYGPLTAYPRPPQTNGAEHYDVSVPNPGFPTDFTAGRITRRNSHNERPSPGWYVWCAWPGPAGYILRDARDNVIYYPTPEVALADLHGVIFPGLPNSPQTTYRLVCPCECNRNPKGFCGGCGHAGCGRRTR